MKSFITYQLIIFSIICVKLNSQNLAVLDIAPINYDHDYSLKISKYIRNIIKNIINIKNQSQKLSDSVVELSQLSQNNLEVQNKIDELSKSFLLLEETVQAFDSYRRQNNEMLQEMQLEISSINMSNTP